MVLTMFKYHLEDVEWQEFFIGGEEGIFDITSTKSGIDKNKLNVEEGSIPYITRSDSDNGINLFVTDEQSEKYKINQGNVITIGLDTQTVFYQANPFFTGQNIQVLSRNNLNKNISMFIIPLIKIQMEKFNWGGNGATLSRLNRTKIMLPVDKFNNPYWNFMEEYIKERENEQKENLQRYYKQRLLNLKLYPDMVDSDKWREFTLQDICDINSGIRLTKAKMKVGNIPFIGATDSNNGITGFVSNINKSYDKNILGVNYNGSVVENFYHPYPSIFSDDVKRLSFKEQQAQTKFCYIFLKQAILQQKEKYQYAYKFNGQRIARQKILLPIDTNGNPNWEYIENYIKIIEKKKIEQILEYLDR